ncbi:hypothetical protein DFH11DRAFT_1628136 [Phellopilus nigrolimitatus]|nr:hypothetical protein DFH11DRAFT_1646712 [Phellopilus nigrolimitatus]KAH8109406.1 hypothetical protein DFH11DRAFT_1628136 [Phellopilus nigrolimitatus]
MTYNSLFLVLALRVIRHNVQCSGRPVSIPSTGILLDVPSTRAHSGLPPPPAPSLSPSPARCPRRPRAGTTTLSSPPSRP